MNRRCQQNTLPIKWNYEEKKKRTEPNIKHFSGRDELIEDVSKIYCQLNGTWKKKIE